MNKPHILFLVVFWAGQLSCITQRFEDGFAAAAAGSTLAVNLTSPTRQVKWSIFPEKT